MAVDLSIIIPARGNGSELIACIESVLAQQTQVRYEVVVAYCSMDNEVVDVVSHFASVRAAIADEYMTPGPARNLGARVSTGKVLAFIDSDCVVQADWVTHAYETIQKGAVLCSGAIKDMHPWNLIASSDNRLQYADFPSGRPRGTARYFPGVHLAVQREVFETLGGFDNSPHGQDVLFTIQIARQWPERVIFNPDMVARHSGRKTWRGLLNHHEQFGHARAYHTIQTSQWMDYLAENKWLVRLLILRRLAYISLRVITWNSLDLPRYLLQLPFLLGGLDAWAQGFHRGSIDVKKGK